LEETVPIATKPLLRPILNNDALTRGLNDPEARMLVEWLVEQVERMADEVPLEAVAQQEVDVLCRRGRAISRFVALWSQPRCRGAAAQLAAAEGFEFPLPSPRADPCETMQAILLWESAHTIQTDEFTSTK
jgi:hypothetical protein